MLKGPSIISFTDDPVKVTKSEYNYTRAYVPTQDVEKDLKRISGKLDECLYDSYRREIDTLKPNVDIDNEMALLIAAEEDVQQSRRNLRRRAHKICPSSGPTQAEEQELKTLNSKSVRKMYELDDFKRDFDTKPFVATEMVDLSFERIVDNIRRRQQALQNLRREIYEDSVLRVAGYYVKATEKKNNYTASNVVKSFETANSKRVSKTDVETKVVEPSKTAKSKRASKTRPKTILVKSTLPSQTTVQEKSSLESRTAAVEKFQPTSSSGSDTEGDESYAAVKEIYRAEKLRLEKNLEMFNKQLQEFIDSHSNQGEVGEASVKSRKSHRTEAKKSEIKTAKTVKASKSDVRTAKSETKSAKVKVKTVKAAESEAKTAKSETKASKAEVKTVKVAKSDANMAKDNVRTAKPVKTAKPNVITVKSAEPEVITVKSAEPDVITVKPAEPDVNDDCQESGPQVVDRKRKGKKLIRLSKAEVQAYVDSCDHEQAEKPRRKKRKEADRSSISTELKVPLSEEASDMDKVKELVVLPLPKLNPMPVCTDKQIPKEKKEADRSSISTELKVPQSEEDSEMDKVKELLVLPLPKLNPMPVYTDNFQASCVLTHLFSSRDDYDEDFEEDYIIPTYESEQMF